ncbi:MAG TPA: AraC family transcriptional regulator [Telluria sp.]|nr:AraC family transcriptional regulator [Telluria sp.]
MDPLSEICASMRVEKALFTRVEATSPWGVRSPAQHGFKLALLVRGSCVLTTRASATPITLRGGDVFIALDGTAYEIYDMAGSALHDCAEVMAALIDDTIVIGGGGAASTLISGCFELDAHDAAPLMSVLPSMLLLRAGEESNRAIEDLLVMLARETARREMGSDATIARLFELLFIHAVRACSEQQALPTTGWLAVTADPHLKHAARAMHRDLAHEWTLESLAKVAGMSRSAFAARFKEKAGQTALDYLIRWRMHKAAHLIRRGDLSLNEVAEHIGYQSEAAFNRMFKREVGTTPGRFKRASRSALNPVHPSSHHHPTSEVP